MVERLWVWSFENVIEVYRIETVASEEAGGGVIRRILVRTDSFEKAKERALKVFSLARRPQSRDPEIEAVRVLNGAGYEVFSISTRD